MLASPDPACCHPGSRGLSPLYAAGARRTATAYAHYLAAIKASDVFVNVPGSLAGMSATRPYELISALPGVAVHRDVPPPSFGVNRTDVIHNKVQQAIKPETVALSLFGAIAALAVLVLVGPGPGSACELSD